MSGVKFCADKGFWCECHNLAAKTLMFGNPATVLSLHAKLPVIYIISLPGMAL